MKSAAYVFRIEIKKIFTLKNKKALQLSFQKRSLKYKLY